MVFFLFFFLGAVTANHVTTKAMTSKKPINSLSYVSSANGGTAFNCDVCTGSTVEDIINNESKAGAEVAKKVVKGVGNLTNNLSNKLSNLGSDITSNVEASLKAAGL